MYQDIGELRAFYDTPLGRVTRRLIRRQITALWPNINGMDIVGLGYSAPYLDIFRSHSKHGAKHGARHGARHVVSIMPALQGVIRWPLHNGDMESDGPHGYKGNLTALAHDGNLPLMDAAIDRILVIHSLEHTESSRHLLREIWRSLAPGGRVIIIVPNRLGLWARTDRTPFGYGTPFSALQLRQLLSENMLTPTQSTSALHLPPFKSRSLLSLMTTFEGTGQKWWHNLAGALIIEAEKQIYATGPKVKARKRAPQPAIAGNHMDSKNIIID